MKKLKHYFLKLLGAKPYYISITGDGGYFVSTKIPMVQKDPQVKGYIILVD